MHLGPAVTSGRPDGRASDTFHAHDGHDGRRAPPTLLDVRVAAELGAALFTALGQVIRGKDEQLRLALVALFSGGHLLIEDVPGVGKTLLAKTLARAIGGEFHRVQATPDLLPADVTGVSVFHRANAAWEFRPGPLFGNVVLVDEINRATPRTQSALLEAMEERQVTVDGETRSLPDPFFVVATQNPHEHAGTFPLVEGQLDRFTLVLHLGYPERAAEHSLLLGSGGSERLTEVGRVADPPRLHAARATARSVHVQDSVADYVLELVDRTRRHPDIELGVSPRGALALLHAAQAHAVLWDRAFVVPADVKAVAEAVLSHRLILRAGSQFGIGTAIIRGLLNDVAVPQE